MILNKVPDMLLNSILRQFIRLDLNFMLISPLSPKQKAYFKLLVTNSFTISPNDIEELMSTIYMTFISEMEHI